MSARAIVIGVVFRAPVAKTSKAGKPYVSAIIREGSGETTRWWKVFVFGKSAIEEIGRLGEGDPIAVAGEFDCSLYAPADAETRLSWTIRADTILSARPRPKPKPDRPARGAENRDAQSPGRAIAARSWAAPARGGDRQ